LCWCWAGLGWAGLGWAGRAARPLTAAQARPLIQRDPTALWKIALLVSGLFNLLLVYRLVFLPR
jgi:hypothetical protein